MKDKNIKILYEVGEKWLYWGEYNMLFKYSKELEEFIIHFSQNINAEDGVNVETNPLYKEIFRIEERIKELRESMAFLTEEALDAICYTTMENAKAYMKGDIIENNIVK